MKTHSYILSLLSTFVFTSAHARLEVHEWGTFTSLVGSNGKTQHGMYHEDEKLPDFVHGFGETLENIGSLSFLANSPRGCDPDRKGCIPDRMIAHNFISQKMETPVIYFYTDRAQPVTVDVRFPQGAVTETFPGPVSTRPTPEDLDLANGQTIFKVDVLATKNADVPPVDSANIYSHARNVNSNIVRAGNETEKFIFYRGLGQYQPRLKITSIGADLYFLAERGFEPQFTFLVDVNSEGHAQMRLVRGIGYGKPSVISGSEIAHLKNHRVRESNEVMSGTQMTGNLLKALMNAGLFEDEAQSMINTWNHGYFKTPGLRVLYILSRSEVDNVLPINISPLPTNLQRAFVGRIEVLREDDELAILKEIDNRRLNFNVNSLGRFAEPILRRVHEVSISTGSGQTSEKLDAVFRELIARAAAL